MSDKIDQPQLPFNPVESTMGALEEGVDARALGAAQAIVGGTVDRPAGAPGTPEFLAARALLPAGVKERNAYGDTRVYVANREGVSR